MSLICQLEKYSATVSELTGRTIYVNNAPDQYLVSPGVIYSGVEDAANWWLGWVAALKAVSRPPPNQRRAVEALTKAGSREAIAETLECLLVSEFKQLLGTTSVGGKQSLLIALMLRLWCCGAVAWPAKEQMPFSQPILLLNNAGFTEQHLSYLNRVRSFLDRKSTDDPANFRFFLDHLLSRAAVIEIGDLTPETFYLTEEGTRLRKMRSPAIQGLLSVLREEHYERAISWHPESFGFFKAKMGRLARDDNFNWLLSADLAMAEWARLAIEHLESNPANFRKRKTALHNFLKHYLEHPELPRNPAEYFDIRRRPAALFDIPGNKGRQVMSVVHEFLNEVLFKVCAQSDDNEVPVLMPGFASPLRRLSYKNVNRGETHREAMPTRLISLAARILTENDFAWAKNVGRIKDTFRWPNPETGEFETVWCPLRAYAILLKLMLPARTYQIRMLDSGEGDTFRYEASGNWESNMGLHRPVDDSKPVERGVFRRYTGVGMLVMDHGLCPVSAKRCHEGLAVTDPSSNATRYQAVPGGATNCTRCRFFMTGPAFLFGLEAHVNDLAYRLKKASFTFEKAQGKFDTLVDEHAASLGVGQPFHKQREIEIAETSFEVATAEVDSIALSLQAAYALSEQCIRIAAQTTDSELALVVAGGTGQLEAVLSEGHEFDQLNRICTAATLFDGLNINWRQPNLERARMFDRMLRNSGFDARFCLLDDAVALHIANAMGRFLYARLDSNTVHSLIDGRTTLRAVGLEKAFVAELENLEPKKLGPILFSSILERA